MRLPIDSLKVKALVVLEEACGRVGRERVPPEPGLRLALAFLFAVSDRDRDLFDAFWKAVVDRAYGKTPEALIVQQGVVPHLNGIYRAVGVQRTVEIMSIASKAQRHRRSGKV